MDLIALIFALLALGLAVWALALAVGHAPLVDEIPELRNRVNGAATRDHKHWDRVPPTPASLEEKSDAIARVVDDRDL